MTNASKAISVAGWTLLSCLVAGCGGEGEENDALDTPVVLNEAGFISVEESDDDPGFCGYLELGIDEFGGQVVAQERYYYSVMNRFLDENTELRDYTGLTQVGSCDEARLFTKLHNDYRDERPATAEDKAALVASLPTMEPEGFKSDPNAPIEKILGGSPDAIEEIVGFGHQSSLGTQNCTGIRLSGTMFLTAAHCLFVPNRERAAGSSPEISFPNAWLKHVPASDDAEGVLYATDPSRCKDLEPNQSCHALQMDGYMNLNFTGTNDRRNDLAVVRVRHASQGAIRNAPEASSEFGVQVGWFATTTPQVGEMVETVGWGPDGIGDKDLTPHEYSLRATRKIPVAAVEGSAGSKVNGIYQGMSFRTTAATAAQICLGDSGGPTYNEYRHVMGVLSLASSRDPVSRSCAAIGAEQWMSRTDWQIFSFIPLAMAALQKGTDTDICHCVFVPPTPGGKDPEAPGAYIRCNEGCKDPAGWTQ